MVAKPKLFHVLQSYSLAELLELVKEKTQMEAEATVHAARKHLTALTHLVTGTQGRETKSGKKESKEHRTSTGTRKSPRGKAESIPASPKKGAPKAAASKKAASKTAAPKTASRKTTAKKTAKRGGNPNAGQSSSKNQA